jgi:nucleotide-binding universal stress UspA family protein
MPTKERQEAPIRKRAVSSAVSKCILVPIDFSTANRAALDAALAWATPSGGTIWLLHVIEPRSFLSGTAAALLVKPETDIFTDAQANLDQLVEQVQMPGVEIGAFVRYGHRTEIICQVAQELAAELIIMGRHHHFWWEQLIASTTAKEVLRDTPCAVLLLPGMGTADDALYFSQDDDPADVGEPAHSRELTGS